MKSLPLMALCVIAASSAAAEPLTFSGALTKAEQSAPSLAAHAADVASARSARTAAGRLPDPKLRVGLDNFPISGPPAGSLTEESMTMGTIGLMQDVPNGAKRKAERDRAQADIGVAKAGQAVEARDVRLNTALAWIDLYYAKRQLAALNDLQETINRLRKAAPAQVTTGTLRPAQALEAEQLEAELGDTRADLVAKVQSAQAALARWTLDPEVDVSGDPPAYDVNPTDLRAALTRNPTLSAYGAMARQADSDVALARAGTKPDWGWDVAYQHRDPRWGDMVSAGVTVSLPLFKHTRQDPIIEAKAQAANKVRYEQDAAYRQLAAQLDADLADHAMHHDRLHRAEMTLVPLAQKKADLERASYGAGTASLNDVLSAQLALAQAKVDALSREADAVRDAARITFTYGSADQ